MLDIQKLLGSINVPFWTSGKNISDGWIAISCPFCGDSSNHCGINSYAFSCWKCGSKGNIKKLLAKLRGGSWNEALVLFDKYNDSLYVDSYVKKYSTVSEVAWPDHCTVELPEVHRNYIKSRGFNPTIIQELYDVRAVYQLGEWKYRLIIPIYMQGVLVSFVGRDITGKAGIRYKNLQKEKSIIPVKNATYNIDSIYEIAIICEGIFDSWRFGIYGVAVMGLQLTAMQINTIAKRLKRAIIIFDNERIARSRAMALGEALAMQGIVVDLVDIDEKDPGAMSQRKADELKKLLNL